MSQGALAEKCGFSQQYLSDLETGKRNPTVITLFEIAQALGIEVHRLLMPSGPEPNNPAAEVPGAKTID